MVVSYSQYTRCHPVINVIIQFSSAILRVGLGVSHGDKGPDSSKFRDTVSSGTRVRGSYSAHKFGDGVQINLQQSVHTHTDFEEENHKMADYSQV